MKDVHICYNYHWISEEIRKYQRPSISTKDTHNIMVRYEPRKHPSHVSIKPVIICVGQRRESAPLSRYLEEGALYKYLNTLHQRFSTFSDLRTTWPILSRFANHQKTSTFYRENFQLPFSHFLKNRKISLHFLNARTTWLIFSRNKFWFPQPISLVNYTKYLQYSDSDGKHV